MAKVKFEKSKSNGVSVKVNIGDDTGFTFERGMYRSIRRNEGADATEYPFIVAFKYFYRFLELNDVDYKEVEIDKNFLWYSPLNILIANDNSPLNSSLIFSIICKDNSSWWEPSIIEYSNECEKGPCPKSCNK